MSVLFSIAHTLPTCIFNQIVNSTVAKMVQLEELATKKIYYVNVTLDGLVNNVTKVRKIELEFQRILSFFTYSRVSNKHPINVVVLYFVKGFCFNIALQTFICLK